jgi:midasin
LNEPQHETELQGYRWLSEAIDITVDFRAAISTLNTMRDVLARDNNLPPSSISKLQRSLLSKREGRIIKDPTLPLATFLENSLMSISDWTVGSLMLALPLREQEVMQEVSTLLQELFIAANQEDFDSTVLQVYLAKARRLGATAMRLTNISSVGQVLLDELHLFDNGWKLSSGGSIDVLWSLLKPQVAEKLSQLRFVQTFKSLAKRLDAMVWRAHASFHHLVAIRSSFAKALEGLTGESLEEHLHVSIQRSN